MSAKGNAIPYVDSDNKWVEDMYLMGGATDHNKKSSWRIIPDKKAPVKTMAPKRAATTSTAKNTT